jgi:hypothetical protein
MFHDVTCSCPALKMKHVTVLKTAIFFKIIKTGRPTPSLTKTVKQLKNCYAIFLILGIKLILGCVVIRNHHFSIVGLISFFKLKEILTENYVVACFVSKC